MYIYKTKMDTGLQSEWPIDKVGGVSLGFKGVRIIGRTFSNIRL